MNHEEVYEIATNWTQGKTAFSINFVRRAEKKLLKMTDEREKNILKKAIEMVKQGEYILTEPETPEEIIQIFGHAHVRG